LSSCVSRITISRSSNGISKGGGISIFATVPQIIAGPGCITRASEPKTRPGSPSLVISDDGAVKAGLVQPGLANLANAGAGATIFAGVVADPPESIIYRLRPGRSATLLPGLARQ
jgi:hypothetical protein